jgi:hypothetical protein
MKSATTRALSALRQGLKEDPRIVELDRLDAELSSYPEILSLSAKMKEAGERYYELTKTKGNEAEETRLAQHELYLAKKALDEAPEAMEYRNQYAVIRRLYAEIDGILFGPFRPGRGDCHA